MLLKGSLISYPWSSKIFIAAGIMLFLMIISYLTGGLLCRLFFDTDIFNDPAVLNNFTDEKTLASLKLLQVFYSLFSFTGAAIICAWLFYEKPSESLWVGKWPMILVVTGSCITLISFPLINFLGEWNASIRLPASLDTMNQWVEQSEKQAEEITNAFIKTPSFSNYLFNLFMIALIPAVGEELLFRGVLQRLFSGITGNLHAGIIIASVLFSAFHMQFLGFFPRLMFGVLFGYMLVWSGSLWVPVVAHFFNNAVSVTVLYLGQFYDWPQQLETLGSKTNEPFFSVLSLLLCSFLLWWFYKKCAADKNEQIV